MDVGILGPLVVAEGAQPIEVGGARLRALLIRLAASAGGWVSVSELVDALWESDPPGDEVNALQSLVSRLRRVLPTAEVIESGPAGYRLAIDPEAVDGIRFERLAVRGRRRLAADDPEGAATLLGEALGLWRGAALVEVAGVHYAMAWAERLEKLRLTAIDQRAEAGLRLGRHPDLIAELEETAAQHPLRERTHELLIRALAGCGRQAEALAVYDRLSRRLARELGLDPPIHLQRLQTAVLRDDPELLAAPERPAPPPRLRPTNLRSPLTSFIGRNEEVASLFLLLKAGSRLITLVGTGGAGKTRLANETLTQMKNVGPDGVWMVQLAPVTDPEDVASTTLGSIGDLDRQILERATATPRDALTRLVETLTGHDVVLILDNCEHVLDAAAKLAEFLLGQCPRLTILATSREPLGIVGESICPVPPLSIPDAGSTGQDALDTAAARLFIDRASLVRPGFTVTAENAGPVIEICRRLDGLPLAIELAAARLRNLTAEAVAARLGNRFRLLNGGNRTAMPRHQTLRAVVSWSWDLLTESERKLAERLSVFPGGATAETAQAICAGAASGELPEDTVADLLMSLADKSLLVVVEPTGADNGAQPRYRMLETIREFAVEQLGAAGDGPELRAAHARYFLQLAETAEPKLRGAEQLPWLDTLTTERDNLLATLRFAIEIEDAELALRLGAALSWYWTLLGRHDEAANWLGQALQVPGDQPAEAYALTLVVYTMSAAVSGLGMPSPEQVDEMVELVSHLDLAEAHPLLSLVEPGAVILRERDRDVMDVLERNLGHPDPWTRAVLNLMSVAVAENSGDLAMMKQRIPLALNGFRAIGDRWGIGTALGTLSTVLTVAGELDEAIAAMEEARRMMTELRSVDDEAHALIRIGLLRLRLSDTVRARREIEAARDISIHTASPITNLASLTSLAAVEYAEGNVEKARRWGEEAMVAIDRAPFSPPQIRAGIHCALATFDVAEGYLDDAVPHLQEAYAAIMESRDMPMAAVLAIAVANLIRARGDSAAAAEMLGASVAIRGMTDRSDPDAKRVETALHAVLTPEEYEHHHTAGRNLTRAEALALIETSLSVSPTRRPEAVGHNQDESVEPG